MLDQKVLDVLTMYEETLKKKGHKPEKIGTDLKSPGPSGDGDGGCPRGGCHREPGPQGPDGLKQDVGASSGPLRDLGLWCTREHTAM